MTPSELARKAIELRDKATQGEWISYESQPGIWYINQDRRTPDLEIASIFESGFDDKKEAIADKDLIVFSANHIKTIAEYALRLEKELSDERAKTAKLREALEVLIEGLEQYANPQNWRYKDNGDVGAFDAWLDFKPGHYSKTHQDLGIHIAKKALQLAEEKVSGTHD